MPIVGFLGSTSFAQWKDFIAAFREGGAHKSSRWLQSCLDGMGSTVHCGKKT